MGFFAIHHCDALFFVFFQISALPYSLRAIYFLLKDLFFLSGLFSSWFFSWFFSSRFFS